jgi:hypothetical protein
MVFTFFMRKADWDLTQFVQYWLETTSSRCRICGHVYPGVPAGRWCWWQRRDWTGAVFEQYAVQPEWTWGKVNDPMHHMIKSRWSSSV